MKTQTKILLEDLVYGTLGGCLGAAMFLLVVLVCLVGCASAPCPPPEVVTVPQVVEVPTLVRGEPLPLCTVDLEVCDQDSDLELVKCLGRNVQQLVVCHERNVGTIASHNQAIE